MKSTGIIRKIDDLGRIVLPIELRKNLGIEIKDPVEIFVEGDMIVLKKYQPSCIFCGNPKDNVVFRDKHICQECFKLMKSV